MGREVDLEWPNDDEDDDDVGGDDDGVRHSSVTRALVDGSGYDGGASMRT